MKTIKIANSELAVIGSTILITINLSEKNNPKITRGSIQVLDKENEKKYESFREKHYNFFTDENENFILSESEFLSFYKENAENRKMLEKTINNK